MTAALLALAAALLLWPSAVDEVVRRLRALHPPPDVRRPGGGPARRRWALATGLGGAAALLLGGAAGGAAGIVAMLCSERLLRRRDRAGGEARTADLLREIPAACDLLAVCLAAGVPLPAALSAVAAAVPGPLGTELGRAAGAQRLGAGPRRSWEGAPPELGPLARTLQRAETSGARAGPALHALAVEARAAQREAADAGVRRAGVWVLAPLGACFLPAFVCLGVVPLVLGIAAEALG